MSWNIEEYLYLKSLKNKSMKTVWVHENTEDEPVEHSVDLDILAQTINDSLMDRLSINDDGLLSDLILDALKSEFKGQSLHMREDEE